MSCHHNDHTHLMLWCGLIALWSGSCGTTTSKLDDQTRIITELKAKVGSLEREQTSTKNDLSSAEAKIGRLHTAIEKLDSELVYEKARTEQMRRP